MGKCKKRTLQRAGSSYYMTREEAVNNVFKILGDTKNIKKHAKSQSFKEALDMISLFGLSAEELSEAGMPYENLKAIESILA